MESKRIKLAERLQELREEKNLSQNELAKRLNIHHSNICRWESGTNIPSVECIVMLCDFFGCTSDYLIGLEDY